METYIQSMERLRSKSRHLTIAMCNYAIADCLDSLNICNGDHQSRYRDEKEREIEVLRERINSLLKPKTRGKRELNIAVVNHRVERIAFSSNW